MGPKLAFINGGRLPSGILQLVDSRSSIRVQGVYRDTAELDGQPPSAKRYAALGPGRFVVRDIDARDGFLIKEDEYPVSARNGAKLVPIARNWMKPQWRDAQELSRPVGAV